MGLRNKENEKEIADGDFWVRFWTGSWILMIFIQYFESFAIDRFLVQLILTYFFIKRYDWAYAAAIVLSFVGFSILFTVSWVMRNETEVGQHFIWWFYGVFYLFFFIFLCKRRTRIFFRNNIDFAADIPSERIKNLVRLCSAVFLVVGLLELLPIKPLIQSGFSTGSLFFGIIYIVLAVGVFSLSNIARLAVIFFGFSSPVTLLLDWRSGHFKYTPQHWFEFFFTIFLFCLAILFTKHKIKSIFH